MQTKNEELSQLIKRLLGFYQTPCTILDGVQYSWPIPLGVCSTDNEPTDLPVVCLCGNSPSCRINEAGEVRRRKNRSKKGGILLEIYF
jgi:hypothetical protein